MGTPSGGQLPRAQAVARGSGADILLTAAVGLVALALYTATLAPGLLWGGGDFAKFQTFAFLGYVEGKITVMAHMLWVLLAHPFTWLPIRDPAWRANFSSAVFASLALVFFFRAARYLTRSTVAALLATGALAVSHTFWSYAVVPKVYSLNALMLAACVYLLLRWRQTGRDRLLYTFAFLYGVSFLNHLVMSTAAAGFALFIGSTLRARPEPSRIWVPLVITAACFSVGLSPYVYAVFQSGAAAGTGDTIVKSLTGLAYPLIHPTALLRGTEWGVALGVYQFPVTTIVGGVGLWTLWRRDALVAGMIALAILGATAFMFCILGPDASAGPDYVWNLHFYLPAYIAFALLLAPGFEVMLTRWSERTGVVYAICGVVALGVPPLLYATAPAVARRVMHNVPDFRPLPGRDNFTYALSPWKHHETGARALTEQILRAVPHNGVLFADYGLWTMIHYCQVVEGARSDVEAVMLPLPHEHAQAPLIWRYRNRPNLFLADTYRYYNLDAIQEHFDLVPVPPIYRLVPKP